MIDYEEEFVDKIENKEDFEIKGCSQACLDNDVECEFTDCKHWMNFGEDYNCDLVSIKRNGPLTLRQVGERLGVSYVRIKQIEDAAIKKIKNSTSLDEIEY